MKCMGSISLLWLFAIVATLDAGQSLSYQSRPIPDSLGISTIVRVDSSPTSGIVWFYGRGTDDHAYVAQRKQDGSFVQTDNAAATVNPIMFTSAEMLTVNDSRLVQTVFMATDNSLLMAGFGNVIVQPQPVKTVRIVYLDIPSQNPTITNSLVTNDTHVITMYELGKPTTTFTNDSTAEFGAGPYPAANGDRIFSIVQNPPAGRIVSVAKLELYQNTTIEFVKLFYTDPAYDIVGVFEEPSGNFLVERWLHSYGTENPVNTNTELVRYDPSGKLLGVLASTDMSKNPQLGALKVGRAIQSSDGKSVLFWITGTDNVIRLKLVENGVVQEVGTMNPATQNLSLSRIAGNYALLATGPMGKYDAYWVVDTKAKTLVKILGPDVYLPADDLKNNPNLSILNGVSQVNPYTAGIDESGTVNFTLPGAIDQYFTATITITADIPTAALAADKTAITLGNQVKLTWNTANVDSASLDNGIGSVPLSGSRTVSPVVTTTYTLTATGSAGTVKSSVTISVTPPLVPPAVLDHITTVMGKDASTAGLAPGSFGAIYGRNLTSFINSQDTFLPQNLTDSVPFPTRLAASEVLICGKPAPLHFAWTRALDNNSSQINFIVPNLPPGQCPVIVNRLDLTATGNVVATSNQLTLNITSLSPEFLGDFSGGVPVFLQNVTLDPSWATFVAKENGITANGRKTAPAKAGDFLILWATGLGATTPEVTPGDVPPSGTLANVNAPVSANLQWADGRQQPVTVLYAVHHPYYSGLYQVAIQVPQDLLSTDQTQLMFKVGDLTVAPIDIYFTR